MLFCGSDFCLLKVSVKVQDKDFTVRPVSPMYGSEDLLFKGGPNSMSQIVPSETYQNYRWHLTLDTDWPKKMTRWRIDKKGEHWGANPITTLSKNINNNLQPNTITSKKNSQTEKALNSSWQSSRVSPTREEAALRIMRSRNFIRRWWR